MRKIKKWMAIADFKYGEDEESKQVMEEEPKSAFSLLSESSRPRPQRTSHTFPQDEYD